MGNLSFPTIATELQRAHERVEELRHDLGELRAHAGRGYRGGLVELDIGRALVALGSAQLALERGRRHAELKS